MKKFLPDISEVKMPIDKLNLAICNPTHVGAPVGSQMPGMNSSEAEAILLNRGN